MFDNLKKTINNYLPGLRRPGNTSLYVEFLSNYGWSALRSDKPLGDFEVYYQALDNVYVFRCIQVEIDTLLGTGFNINNLDEYEVNIARTNYLNNVFNNPEGYKNDTTYAMFHSQYIRSFEGIGDSFIEVNHEKAFNNTLSGFRFIPSELLKFYPDTEQWGYRNYDIRYEPEELIHIYEPDIKFRGNKWGLCKIDKIGLAISLMFLGMKYNKKLLDNDGLDPKAILSFDKDIDNDTFDLEVNRLKIANEQRKKGGTLAVKGATLSSAAVTNRDMDWNELLNKCRDIIVTCFGVQPSNVGIRETASLGSGTGESPDKDFQDVLSGRAELITGAFNKCLGRNGFDEVFQFNEMDIEDKLKRAQIEDIRLRNGSLSINEVRSRYGDEPVNWGNVPMNYPNYGVTPNVLNPTQVQPLGYNEQDLLKSYKTLKEYKNKIYASDLITEW